MNANRMEFWRFGIADVKEEHDGESFLGFLGIHFVRDLFENLKNNKDNLVFTNIMGVQEEK